MEAKERILGLDLIRSICALIIVWYHIACYINAVDGWPKDNFFFTYANGNWGEITVVSVFFMLSGASLLYKYKDMSFKDIPKFYKKRWLSIFPSFFLVWFFIYFQNVLLFKNFFYAGGLKHLIFSFIGMDGYLSYRFQTYYIIGEWFLGAIVLLYALFPFVLFAFRKAKWIISVLLLSALFFVLYSDVFLIAKTRNLITCLIAMWIGMLLTDHLKLIRKNIFCIISAVLVILLLVVKIPIPEIISMILMGTCIFIILLKIGDLILTEDKIVYKVVRFLSDESYQVFLIQHVIIINVFTYFTGLQLDLGKEILLIIFITCSVIFLAWVLLLVNNRIIQNFSCFLIKKKTLYK